MPSCWAVARGSALFGERFVVFVDAAGALVRSVDVADRVDVFLDPVTADQCLAVGDEGGPYTLLDARTGVIVTSFDDGALVGHGADGCVVGFGAADAAGDDLVAGLIGAADADRVDQRLADRVLAVSGDGTAAIDTDGATVSWVDLVGGEVTELVSRDETDATEDTEDTEDTADATDHDPTPDDHDVDRYDHRRPPPTTDGRDAIVAAAFATR